MYTITEQAYQELNTIGRTSEAQRIRARLTTLLVEMRRDGEKCPVVTTNLINSAIARSDLHPHQRANRLLGYLCDIAPRLGGLFKFDEAKKTKAMIVSESSDEQEVGFLANYLHNLGLVNATITGNGQLIGFEITVNGHAHVYDIAQATDPAQVFVAMWFGNEVKSLYDNGIKPAVEAAGYEAMRIDQKLDVDKIDDAIIAEIRRSRFIVADFTHGDSGARGGVYYEAGFAYGLGKPVIFTCREDLVGEIHFDTRQYNHVLWKEPEDLVTTLRDRIVGRIGEGPNLYIS